MDPSSPSERSARQIPLTTFTLSHRPRQGPRPESDSPNRGDGPIPDDDHSADLPMNLTASVMLTGLPHDAHQALADVEAIDAGKGKTRCSRGYLTCTRTKLSKLFPHGLVN